MTLGGTFVKCDKTPNKMLLYITTYLRFNMNGCNTFNSYCFFIWIDSEAQQTLLHFAANHGLKELINVFLDLPGAKLALSTCNKSGLMPRDVARENGRLDLVELLDTDRYVDEVRFLISSRVRQFWKKKPLKQPWRAPLVWSDFQVSHTFIQ